MTCVPPRRDASPKMATSRCSKRPGGAFSSANPISTRSNGSGCATCCATISRPCAPTSSRKIFQQFWQYNSPAWAAKFLDDWCDQVMRSRIEPMKKIAKTLRRHRQLILNYFHAKKQFSSGVVEGLNNKAKLTMRKAYGFRTFRITEIALYHALGDLPQPHAAHRFY